MDTSFLKLLITVALFSYFNIDGQDQTVYLKNQTQVTLKKYNNQDLQEKLGLIRLLCNDSFTQNIGVSDLFTNVNNSYKQGDIFLICKSKKEPYILGLSIITPSVFHTYLQLQITDPNHQKQGISSALLEYAQNKHIQKKLPIFAHTTANNLPEIKILHNNSFHLTPTSIVNHYICKPNNPYLLFVKKPHENRASKILSYITKKILLSKK